MIAPIAASISSLGALPLLAGQPAPSGPAKAAPAPTLHTNPVPRIDLALGIVILSFFAESGVLARTIPTQKQLEAYRLHGIPADAAAG